MTNDLISREDAKSRLRHWITECLIDGDNDAADHFRDCIDLLDDIDCVDAVPVVRGEWGEWENNAGHYCTVCGKDALCDGVEEEVLSDFCPNCGAAMTDEAIEIIKKRRGGKNAAD